MTPCASLSTAFCHHILGDICLLNMYTVSGFYHGSIGSLVLLSEPKSWNGIVLKEPAPLACFGFECSELSLFLHILKLNLVGFDITLRN